MNKCKRMKNDIKNRCHYFSELFLPLVEVMQNFDENQFHERVNKALERVRTILENTRTPQYAADVQHEYDYKYLLAEFLTNSTIAACFNSLEKLGVDDAKKLNSLKEWAKTRSGTLRFKAEERCKFLKKTEREVKSDTT